MVRLVVGLWLFIVFSLTILGAEYYVDNIKGDDVNPGTKYKPFKNPFRGLKAIKSGDTLHFVANSEPYILDTNFRIEVAGTKENPTVIDGHGAVVSGLKRRPAKDWKDEGNGVFSVLLKNNAHVMDNYWRGGFPIVFFDGKPGKNCQNQESLEPLSYFLYKNRRDRKNPKHNMLYIKLPKGKTPDEVEVKTVTRAGIHVHHDFVTVRNLVSEYTPFDGFSTGGGGGKKVCGKEIVLENCEARFCMDQGTSQHGSNFTAKNCWFHHNAGCGIVDVYLACKTSYFNCLVEYDTYRGGVELLSGEYLMEGCVIRFNQNKAMTIRRNAKATIRNCLFIGTKDGKSSGLIIGSDATEVTVKNCTFYGFNKAITLNFIGSSKVTVKNCAFINCNVNIRSNRVITSEEGKDAKPDVFVDYNAMTPGKSFFQIYDKPKHKVLFNKDFKVADFNVFKEKTGFEKHSIILDQTFNKPPYSLPGLKGKGENGANIGASLDPKMKFGVQTD